MIFLSKLISMKSPDVYKDRWHCFGKNLFKVGYPCFFVRAQEGLCTMRIALKINNGIIKCLYVVTGYDKSIIGVDTIYQDSYY